MTSGADTTAQRRRARGVIAAAVLAGIAALVVAIAGAHVQPTRRAGGGPDVPSYNGPTLVQTAPPASGPPSKRVKPNLSTSIAGAVLFVLGAMGVLAAIAILVLLARTALRRRTFTLRRPRRVTADSGPDAAPDVADPLREALVDALGELSAGRPATDAIIRCWQRLGAAAAEVGLDAAPSDTAEEAITRLLRAGRARYVPLHLLADLYREARFSGHTMSDDDVAKARAALAEVIAELAEPPAPDSGAHAPA